MTSFHIDSKGFYGKFGGAFVPDVLLPNIQALQEAYLSIIESEDFQREFHELLRDYVGRPSPLYYARRLSEKYGAKIYLKREDLNHTGAHKINNALGQILLAKRMGKKRIIAETGAGQHGVATATACALMGLECSIYMGALDVERQHVNVERMRMLGATVLPAESGNKTLKDAVNEALMAWCESPEDTFYLISKEIKAQLKVKEGRDYPDYLMACIGGGSNAAGAMYHYLDEQRVKLILAEAGGLGQDSGATAATINIGSEGVLHGSRTLVMQTPEGEVQEPYSISAGLDYPGIGPLISHWAHQNRAEVLAINDDEALRAAFELTRLEGIIPALESSHALALLARLKFQPEDVVVINVSGRGDKDISTYLAHKAEILGE